MACATVAASEGSVTVKAIISKPRDERFYWYPGESKWLTAFPGGAYTWELDGIGVKIASYQSDAGYADRNAFHSTKHGLPSRRQIIKTISILVATKALVLAVSPGYGFADDLLSPTPPSEEQQLPFAMHSKMDERPSITVGREDTDLIGRDNRALQAAVDYIAALGGGVVRIGPGEYRMRDSLHLRSNVVVRGTVGRTTLKKASAAVSPLAIDGDYGEQQNIDSNTIRDTREGPEQTQEKGLLIEQNVGTVTLRNNQIEAKSPVDDQR